MEQNLHETTNWWKTYGKQLFSEDLEVRDALLYEVQYHMRPNFATLCYMLRII
jgi:hypothetical protein